MTLIHDPDGVELPAIFHDPQTDEVRAAPPVYFAPIDAQGNRTQEFAFLGHLIRGPFVVTIDDLTESEEDTDGPR